MAITQSKKSNKPRIRRKFRLGSSMTKKPVGKTIRLRYKIDPVTQWIADHSEEVNQHTDEYIGIDANNFRIVASSSSSTELFKRIQGIDSNIEIITFKVPPIGLSM
jgi:hypothetical protein